MHPLSPLQNTINNDYNSITFPYTTGESFTEYDIIFYEDTKCDILIVAGGGGGTTAYRDNTTVAPGGGGAGGLIFLETQTV